MATYHYTTNNKQSDWKANHGSSKRGYKIHISQAQKGAIQGELGTAECTFMLRCIIEHHRRNQMDLCVVFLNATNGFGNIEPALIKQAIQMCALNNAYKKLWLDLNKKVSIHIIL